MQRSSTREGGDRTPGDTNSASGGKRDAPLAQLSRRLRMWILTACTVDNPQKQNTGNHTESDYKSLSINPTGLLPDENTSTGKYFPWNHGGTKATELFSRIMSAVKAKEAICSG
ncbi:Uncharacterized protein DAT39_006818, partial [Clarias magur]